MKFYKQVLIFPIFKRDSFLIRKKFRKRIAYLSYRHRKSLPTGAIEVLNILRIPELIGDWRYLGGVPRRDINIT